jgi:hypothetical protein
MRLHAARMDGGSVNAEPHKHSELIWAGPGRLPSDTIGYTAAEHSLTFTLNGW